MSTNRWLSCFWKKNEEEEPLAEDQVETSDCPTVDAWVLLQFAYNMLNTTAKTGYTTAKLVTDGVGLEPIFLGLSQWGMAVSMPVAVMFALAEAFSHQAQSEHFNHADDKTVPMVDEEAKTASLTCLQKLLVGIHYISDVSEGISTPLLIAGLAGIDEATPVVRWSSYAAFTLYSALGNVQELKNAIVAFREKNQRMNEPLVSDRHVQLSR